MIPNYVYPQLQIKEILDTEVGSSTDRFHAVVIGPQYDYVDLDTDTPTPVTVSSAGSTIPLSYTDSASVTHSVVSENQVPDASSLRVFLTNGEIDAFAISGYTDSNGYQTPVDAATPNVVKSNTSNKYWKAALSSDLLVPLNGRNIELGDKVYAYNPTLTSTVTRTVTGFIGADVAATLGNNAAATNGLPGLYTSNPSTQASATSTLVSSPVNYDAVTVASPTGVRPQAVAQGFKHINSSGAIKFGPKITFTILSYNSGTNSGLASASVYGSTVAGNVPFTFAATGGATYTSEIVFNLSATAILLNNITFRCTNAALLPTVGQTFVVAQAIRYVNITPGTQILITGTIAPTVTDADTYIVEVTSVTPGTSATFTIYDILGKDSATTATVTLNNSAQFFALGTSGLFMEFVNMQTALASDQIDFVKGDKYFVNVKGASKSTTQFDRLVLSGPCAFSVLSGTETMGIKVRKVVSGELDGTQLSSGSTGWTYDSVNKLINYASGLTWFVPAFASGSKYPSLVNAVGSLYAVYRASLPVPLNEPLITIDASDDLSTKLGKIGILNDIGWGAYWARSGGQGKKLFALRTSADTVDAYTVALKKIERNDHLYALVPMSSNITIANAVAAHCDAMSAQDKKNFRRSYFGTDSPGEYTVLDKDPNGVNYTATVGVGSHGFSLVTFTSNVGLLSRGLNPGDFVVFSGTQYPIASVVSDTEIELSSGLIGPSLASAASIVKADTVLNTKAYVISRSVTVASRRACNVWCENGLGFDESGNQVIMPAKFIAAEVAGLRCAKLPWLGLSRTEIASVFSAPMMYTRYSTDDLDDVAANGTFIINQDIEGGEVYIRHQLTTDSSEGSLYYEDSVGTNVDEIAFQFKDIFEPLIGKFNVTPRSLAYFRQLSYTLLRNTTLSDKDPLIGPQLISFADVNGNIGQVTVIVDPTFKDRIKIQAKLEVPLPGNVVFVELEAVTGLTI